MAYTSIASSLALQKAGGSSRAKLSECTANDHVCLGYCQLLRVYDDLFMMGARAVYHKKKFVIKALELPILSVYGNLMQDGSYSMSSDLTRSSNCISNATIPTMRSLPPKIGVDTVRHRISVMYDT